MKLIDKSVLVAEIKRRKEINKYRDTNDSLFEDEAILSFIDTLEVKEVDLEKEIKHWQGCEAFPEGVNITPLPKAMDIVERTTKYFFELGLKAKLTFDNNDSNPYYKEALKYIEDNTEIRYYESRDVEGFRRCLDMEKEYYVDQYVAKKAIKIAIGYKN